MIKKGLSVLSSLILILLLVGCSNTSSLTSTKTEIKPTTQTTIHQESTTSNTFTVKSPTNKGTYYKLSNRAYADDSKTMDQIYDLYLPENYEELDSISVCLFLHGGTWVFGSKDMTDYQELTTLFKDELVVNNHIAFITMNYRLISLKDGDSPSMYDMLDDIDSCINDFKKVLTYYGLRVNKLIIGGHSAGAHLALLYSYMEERRESSAIPLDAVYSLSGPVNISMDQFLPYLNSLKQAIESGGYIFGLSGSNAFKQLTGMEYTEANFETAIYRIAEHGTESKTREEAELALPNISPINYVNQSSIRTLILHGSSDSIVPFSQARELNDKLNSYNIEKQIFSRPTDHMGIVSRSNLVNSGFLAKLIEWLLS